MTKFFGPIGFVTHQEIPVGSGIWKEVAVERNYRGEVTKNYKRWDRGENLNDDLNINNTISIVADPYCNENLYKLRYIKWLGSYWKVSDVEVQYPRLILSLGGVYNGPTVGASTNIGEHPRVE